MRISAEELLTAVLDPESFVSWDSPPVDVGPGAKYAEDLAKAREKSGVDESVVTGVGTVRGRRVAVIACEFSFLAGSIGVAAAERIVTAVERATAEQLPLLASPTSGGTRMQEGTVAFVQMVKIAAAVAVHKAAHLPYLVYLRNPTTGGVFASWGSLGHITVAEPGALVGFLGPRVYESLYGEKFPDGIQTSENLYRNGVIDGVVPVDRLRLLVNRALCVLTDPPAPAATDPIPSPEIPDVPAWQSVMLSRRADRPGIRQLLRHAATEQVPLSGTGQGETDKTILLSLARFRGFPCILLGQDRSGQSALTTMGPAALREARRGMKLAEELQLPLVLVIDTLGASLSKEAEERGLAPENRPLHRRPRDAEDPDSVGVARPGNRRRGACAAARRSGTRGTERVARSPAAGRRKRDRPSRHQSRTGDGGSAGHSFVGSASRRRDRRDHSRNA